MKRILLAIVFIIPISIISCIKICSPCDTPPGPITFELRDSQNRDLLNPATPGHYDTAIIRQLNNNEVRIIPNGLSYVPDTDRIKLVIAPDFASAPTPLYLSQTVTDTVYTHFQEKHDGCCTYFKLVTFKYDNVLYNNYLNSYNSQYFIVKK